MRRTIMGLLCGVMLACVSAAMADTPPDLSLLTYNAPAATPVVADTPAADQTQRVLNIDLWLDGTENMGGVNAIDGSLYPLGAEDVLCTGGFHYLKLNQAGGKELHGWYLDILSALPELMGEKRATLRVLRYSDEVYSDALLAAYGLDVANAASLRRDLMTWTDAASPQTFRDMVTPSAAEGFYGLGSEALNRVSAVTTLENSLLRDQLAIAQQAGLAAARSGDPDALVNRDAGDSHLLHALSAMDTSKLNILTLDTWSLGNPTVTVGGVLTDPYAELLASLDLFGTRGLTATIFALRLDYIGSVTSYASLTPKEALHWGRISQNADTKRYSECAMPRCMLMLVLGQAEQVQAVSDRLENFFRTDETLNGAPRGYQKGDGAVTLVNYAYGGELYEKSETTFAYVRSDLKATKLPTVTEQDDACTVALNGTVVSADGLVIHPEAEGGYSNQTVTVTVALPPEAEALGVDPAGIQTSARLKQTGGLLLTGKLANTQENRSALEKSGAQVIPWRDTLWVFDQATLTGADLALAYTPGALTFTLTLPGDTLVPGWVTLTLSAPIGQDALSQQETLPWLADVSADGAADAGKWDYETGESMPQEWLVMPAAIAGATGENRKLLLNRPRHAWCVSNQADTLGRTPNIPPVFRLLNASRLVAALQQSTTLGERVPARITLTIKIDNR